MPLDLLPDPLLPFSFLECVTGQRVLRGVCVQDPYAQFWPADAAVRRLLPPLDAPLFFVVASPTAVTEYEAYVRQTPGAPDGMVRLYQGDFWQRAEPGLVVVG